MGYLKINGNLLMPLKNTRMILGSNGTTDYVDICFKRCAKNN